ncbi:MAG: ABC transporter permease [Anaerolineales bacterium]|jgi:peptide/nickel transport system permease protein|nr:ABC transporter permease [Anaerolineales bacterium]
MTTYIVRRLLWTMVVLLGVSLVTFTILYIMPNDPGLTIAGPRASPEVRAEITRNLGLDKPLWVQYAIYINKILHGDLGTSWIYRQKVTETLIQRIPFTAQLAFAGIFFELLFGLPVGLISALYRGSFLDRLLMVITIGAISAPPFWVGPMLLFIFALKLGLFPVGGYGTPIHLVLPAVTIGLMGGAWYARIFRSSILDALDSDYVRTAHAKGQTYWKVVFKHIIPNCLTSVVSMFALDIGIFFGGVVVVEKVFGWPGIGLSAWKAIRDMDIPVLMGTVLFASLVVTLSNLLADILYAFLDPRIRLG